VSILDNFYSEKGARECKRCGLAVGRKSVVLYSGSEMARIMVIGEAPGAQEDEQGLPFVGPSGKLLDRMLAEIQVDREEVYITNVVKCRPPDNRVPTSQEIEACRPLLGMQIRVVRPEVILTLGKTAGCLLRKKDCAAMELRSASPFMLSISCIGDEQPRTIPVVATYHPAYLLRMGVEKMWPVVQDDMGKVLSQIF